MTQLLLSEGFAHKLFRKHICLLPLRCDVRVLWVSRTMGTLWARAPPTPFQAGRGWPEPGARAGWKVLPPRHSVQRAGRTALRMVLICGGEETGKPDSKTDTDPVVRLVGCAGPRPCPRLYYRAGTGGQGARLMATADVAGQGGRGPGWSHKPKAATGGWRKVGQGRGDQGLPDKEESAQGHFAWRREAGKLWLVAQGLGCGSRQEWGVGESRIGYLGAGLWSFPSPCLQKGQKLSMGLVWGTLLFQVSPTA